MDLKSLKVFARESRRELIKSINLKINFILRDGSLERRENPNAIRELENKISLSSKENVVEEVAYIWFNRFTALQYMDINGFNKTRVIIPAEGKTRPEILANAFIGKFDKNFISEKTKNIVSAILDGKTMSNDPEKQSYKLLIVSVCNTLYSKMPFLFERIADYTELLLPDDLLSKTSIIAKIRNVLTIENCKNIEVIGWLYQFYISEKKDEVFAKLKKNKKVLPEDIPAATQLFTPKWIVKYLIQNSLGRLWILNNPNTNLISKLEFYINSEETEKEFLKINSPEEIKILDPACGSGHMLIYAFEILYLIYEEEGYNQESIPSLILKNNLYGVELDKRAGALAAFSLSMKARENNPNFLENLVQPNICVLENINFESDELEQYFDALGIDLFTNPLKNILKEFKESNNLGSLIEPSLEEVEELKEKFFLKNCPNDLFLKFTHDRIIKVINYCDYLRKKYHIVISNPPYMGLKGMNMSLSKFAKNNFPDSKSDLFAMFMERSLNLILQKGFLGMINMQSWMFLSSYEKLRIKLLNNSTLLNMIHIGPRGFDSIGGEVVSTTAFVFKKSKEYDFKGSFLRLINGNSELEKSEILRKIILNRNSNLIYKISANNLKKIPGKLIAYWISDNAIKCFESNNCLSDIAELKVGLQTGSNDKFVRFWSEVSIKNISFIHEGEHDLNKKWFPYNKGGDFRKWYGNNEHIVNWQNKGYDIINFKDSSGKQRSRPQNKDYYFKNSVTWSFISSSQFGARYSDSRAIFDVAGSSAFPNESMMELICGLLCSKVSAYFLSFMNPTMNFQIGDVGSIPIIEIEEIDYAKELINKIIEISKSDWDTYETSWNFKSSPLLCSSHKSGNLKKTYEKLRNFWHGQTEKMKKLEEENNKIFINAYGLQEELKPNLDIDETTIFCNPSYRYGVKISKNQQEEKLCSDTLKEFISFSVGCMFGRYSLDKTGIILANQGENLADYLDKIPNPSFMPDEDNIIPILELDWFEDDITERFKQFLRITFGNENFSENIIFIENSIGKDIRKYFLNDFYKDHIQTYNKRPIYWLLSSPKGSFNALIYIHRYQKDTLSILLDKYINEFLLKLRSEKNILERLEISSQSSSIEKTNAMKKIQKIDSILNELNDWERDIIFPLASQRFEFELDDGIKNNYPKFGNALKKISGLN